MARQPRIEFPGAVYHVMCRGDRRELIFEDDDDRCMFLRTLGECCQKSGWRIYAFALMPNHYHWVVQTPEANLVAGMKWFQNTYTRRLNTRHKQWGHVFGGRYKAILVEGSSGDYLEILMDYVHLNPVRAGLVDIRKGQRLRDFPWSSLALGYAQSISQRPSWMAVKEGLELFGEKDEAQGRRRFMRRLEKRALEGGGHVEGPRGELQSTLRRGWYWGSQTFREKMLDLVKRAPANRNYRTSAMGRQKDRQEAEVWLEKARAHFGVCDGNLTAAPRSVRLAAAWALCHCTNQPQSWIAEQLGLWSAANVSQQVRRLDSANAPKWSEDPLWRQWRKFVKNC